MPSATDRLEFAPPPTKGSPRAYALAVLVHVLLIAALTWGVNWKRSDESASFEAELWSSVPQQAAPRLVEVTPPAPVPAPPPVATAPPPPPPPPPRAPEIKASPLVPDVDIALEQEKKRKLQQQLKQAEAQKAEKLQEKREAELQAKREKELEKKKEKELKAKEELAAHKAQEVARKAEAKKQEARDQEKQEQAAEAAAEKQKSAAAAAAKQKLAAAAAAKSRQDNLNRMMGMAGATGAAGAKGSAKSASGPSAGYAGKVRAKVLPNVVFTDDIAGNPQAEVEVTTTADGSILSQRLTKSSGNKAWDDAVIKAIVKTGAMPRDVDGRIPSPMILEFKPRG